MSVTVTVPKFNGDGSVAKFTLQLPGSAVNGAVAWASGTTGTGTVTASNDGQSAIFTPVAGGSTTITATIATGLPAWQPGHLYRLNDEIVDQNGKIQQVTAATKRISSTYTPYAGDIPGSISLVLTGGSATSGTNSVVISSISATVPATFIVGQTVTIAGMTSTAAPLNGTWTLTATATHSITLSYNGSSLSTVSVTSASTATVYGDATQFVDEYGGSIISSNSQFGSVLNQGDGTNGDWPAGATAAISGNILKPYPTTAASVTWVSAGYSTGKNIGGQDNGPAGVSSPAPIVPWLPNHNYTVGFVIVDEGGFFQKVRNSGVSGTQYPHFGETLTNTTTDGTVTWINTGAAAPGYTNEGSTYQDIATYSEIGPDGYIEYYDAAGNLHSSGWVTATGTVVWSIPDQIPPAFATSGGGGPAGNGTTIDGDLTWTYQSASSTITTYNGLTITVSTAAGILPVPYNYIVVQ